MILSVDIISQPFSGQYMEKIYDISSPWNSTEWTWVKFVNDDLTEWCGEFRGLARDVALSKKYNLILILTSDYLYKLDVIYGGLIEYISQPQYQSLTVSPLGDFIVTDYYHIYTIETSLNEEKSLSSYNGSVVKTLFSKFIMNQIFTVCICTIPYAASSSICSNTG